MDTARRCGISKTSQIPGWCILDLAAGDLPQGVVVAVTGPGSSPTLVSRRPKADARILLGMTKRTRRPPDVSAVRRKALVAVVDDDESVRESLPDLLRELGFAARAFASADEYLRFGYIEATSC